MNVHGPALKLHTKLTQRRILSDSAFHAHSAFKYYLSTEDSVGQCRIGGQGGCAESSSLYLFIYGLEYTPILDTPILDRCKYTPILDLKINENLFLDF